MHECVRLESPLLLIESEKMPLDVDSVKAKFN